VLFIILFGTLSFPIRTAALSYFLAFGIQERVNDEAGKIGLMRASKIKTNTLNTANVITFYSILSSWHDFAVVTKQLTNSLHKVL